MPPRYGFGELGLKIRKTDQSVAAYSIRSQVELRKPAAGCTCPENSKSVAHRKRASDVMPAERTDLLTTIRLGCQTE